MRRVKWAIAMLAALAIGRGCGPGEAAPEGGWSEGVSTTVSDDSGGVDLSVETDATSLTTAERLRVRITVRRPMGAAVTLIEPDWGEGGWTLIETLDSAPGALPDGRVERSRTVLLEPFLDGSYEIPAVSVSWTREGAEGALSSQPLTVEVGSVLSGPEDGVISGPAPPATPDEPGGRSWATGLVAAGVLLGAGIIGYVLARPRAGDAAAEAAPEERLRAIAMAARAEDGDLEEVHRSLEALVSRGAVGAEALHELIVVCERARFGPEGGGSPDACRVARSALRVLEGGA